MRKIFCSIYLALITVSTINLGYGNDQKRNIIVIGDAIYNNVIKCSSDKECNDFRKLVKLTKNGYTLIDIKQKRELEQKIRKSKADSFLQMGVGSATNTIKIIAKFGGKTGFIGNVGDDKEGEEFYHNLRDYGINTFIDFEKGKDTAVSFVFVDLDGSRSMATYIGAAQDYNSKDIRLNIIKKYEMLMIEAYLWNADKSSVEAILSAVDYAKANNMKVALTLGAESIVTRYREEILKTMEKVDMVFGNKYEFAALFQSDKEKDIVTKARQFNIVFLMTTGENGVTIITPKEFYRLPAEKAKKILDKTGAGDGFAGGFLYNYLVKREDLEQSAKFGVSVANQIIQKFGTTLD